MYETYVMTILFKLWGYGKIIQAYGKITEANFGQIVSCKATKWQLKFYMFRTICKEIHIKKRMYEIYFFIWKPTYKQFKNRNSGKRMWYHSSDSIIPATDGSPWEAGQTMTSHTYWEYLLQKLRMKSYININYIFNNACKWNILKTV
jgi:hypothetical protein